MVVHTCNPSTQEVEQEDPEFEAILTEICRREELLTKANLPE
jgi:hypothetical protein